MAKFCDGIHQAVPVEVVPPGFQQLRQAAADLGIRAELVVCKVGTRVQHGRVQFRIQGGKHKWWRVAYWHPHNGRVFLATQARCELPSFVSDQWGDVLRFVVSRVL